MLVTELSRWGGSTTDLLASLKELEARRVSLVALNGMTFDLTTPHGRMMATLLAGIAEFERELTVERLRSGNRNSEFHSWNKPVPFRGSAEEIAAGLDETDWKRLSAGAGTKGPTLYDWAYCELADLDGPASGDASMSCWTRGLLIRRNIADGALAYFSTWYPQGTGIETLVHVEGHRWSVEDDFETGKNEFGLDHNETRSWHGWHRHVSLSMLALAMMCADRHRANLADHQINFFDSVC